MATRVEKVFICSLILLAFSIVYKNSHATPARSNDLPVACGKQVMCVAGVKKGDPDICHMLDGDRWAFPNENHPDNPQGANVYRLSMVSVTPISQYWIAGECWYADMQGGLFIFRSSDKYVYTPYVSESKEWTGSKTKGFYCDALNYPCYVQIQENKIAAP